MATSVSFADRLRSLRVDISFLDGLGLQGGMYLKMAIVTASAGHVTLDMVDMVVDQEDHGPILDGTSINLVLRGLTLWRQEAIQ